MQIIFDSSASQLGASLSPSPTKPSHEVDELAKQAVCSSSATSPKHYLPSQFSSLTAYSSMSSAAGEYAGEVGLYAGDVGEYAGDVGEYAGEVGEYAGEVGE